MVSVGTYEGICCSLGRERESFSCIHVKLIPVFCWLLPFQSGDPSPFNFVRIQAQNVLHGELFGGLRNRNPESSYETQISMTT